MIKLGKHYCSLNKDTQKNPNRFNQLGSYIFKS